ncbi:hypothetical protein CEXT_212551 [Caerostris extrusa]|uniref:Uncharacterized protein n=1 Tax=Caerostris extrusa TaxID=172846 RepID=A0AAV4WVJ9_CAEEX|nr:hypothetical protein CEXT_212551 [Caerostris extrusa]
MNDVLGCVQTSKNVKELQHQPIAKEEERHCLSGLEISLNRKKYDFVKITETKTFEVSWSPAEDYFSFKVRVGLADFYTKRSILLTIQKLYIAKIFDSLGLLGSVNES